MTNETTATLKKTLEKKTSDLLKLKVSLARDPENESLKAMVAEKEGKVAQIKEQLNGMKEEEETMTETTVTVITFKHNDTYFTREKTGYHYGQPVGGIKKRISKKVFDAAYEEYLNAEWQRKADEEKAKQEEAKKAQYEADEKAVLGAEKATEDKKTGETPAKKDNAKKATKKARKSKDIAYTYYDSDDVETRKAVLTLTAKQVDFIKHIPDTCFYEHGLESTPWCDVLAEEIGGQFAGKPMTVGAMISTLREKDLIYVGTEKVNGRKAKYFGFTEMGMAVAIDLGLE